MDVREEEIEKEKVKWRKRNTSARVSSVGARKRSVGLAVGASNVSSGYCIGVPVYLVRDRALVRIVRSD